MAKITRKRLARGSKLTTVHVHNTLASAATELNGATIEADQCEKPYGTFRVNLNIPYIASDYRTTYTDEAPDPDVVYDVAIPYGIPFTLPPMQEGLAYSADGSGVKTPAIDEDTGHYILDEVSFSFDQRGEPAAIADHFAPTATGNPSDGSRLTTGKSTKQGFLAYEDASRLEITISILEKRQHFFHSGVTLPDREIFSAVIPPEALMGNRVLRFNPFVVTDIAKTLSPYKTYIFTVFCPALIDAEGKDSNGDAAALHRTLALVNIQASMKFKSKLMSRDSFVASSSETQNIPSYSGNTAHKGLAKTRTAASQAISITAPGVNTVIKADDDTSGISKLTASVDDAFREKLRGGYSHHGELHVAEELKHDASYEVISVPLFQNRRCSGLISDQVETDPHFHSTHANSLISDRRIIPILHPMTIHHVILAWNWSAWVPLTVGGLGSGCSVINQSATYKAEFGVAMLSGLRGDAWKYEGIASTTLLGVNTDATTWDNYLIDRVKVHPDTPSPTGKTGVTASADGWDWELHQMRLLATSDARPGYYAQGWPIFVGETWFAPDGSPRKGSSLREDMSDGSGAATTGCEQYIEVRGVLSDANGLKSSDAATDDSVLVGYQGCMVYIIGKKHLL